MFWLTKISDIIRLEPAKFSGDTEKALEDEINKKYANKVIHNTGLCICFYDLLSFGEGKLKPGDGSAYVKVEFRLVVFRPFIGEILIGWVSSCTKNGIHVRMEFFDDIFIPASSLFQECSFIPKEQAWIWKSHGTDFYIDLNEKIRFRVEEEVFIESHPGNPNENAHHGNSSKREPPYSILGSCSTDGMGLVSWWEDGADGDEDEDEDDEEDNQDDIQEDENEDQQMDQGEE